VDIVDGVVAVLPRCRQRKSPARGGASQMDMRHHTAVPDCSLAGPGPRVYAVPRPSAASEYCGRPCFSG
jgi:hypothetical protein